MFFISFFFTVIMAGAIYTLFLSFVHKKLRQRHELSEQENFI